MAKKISTKAPIQSLDKKGLIPRVDPDTIPENTCKELNVEGKHIAVCKHKGLLEYYELMPLQMDD
jgi:hypothetical protein